MPGTVYNVSVTGNSEIDLLSIGAHGTLRGGCGSSIRNSFSQNYTATAFDTSLSVYVGDFLPGGTTFPLDVTEN